MDKKNWVTVTLPRAFANEEQTLMVGINGVNYLLPRGRETVVPPEVAAEVARAQQALLGLDRTVDRLLAAKA